MEQETPCRTTATHLGASAGAHNADGQGLGTPRSLACRLQAVPEELPPSRQRGSFGRPVRVESQPPDFEVPVSLFHTRFGAARTVAYAGILCREESLNEVGFELRSLLGRLVETFRLFDLDGGGFATVEEVCAAMHALGRRCKVEEVRALVDLVDTSRDGHMSVDEFINFALLNDSRLGREQSGMVGRFANIINLYSGQQVSAMMTPQQVAAQERISKTASALALWLPDTTWRRRWDMFILACTMTLLSRVPHLQFTYRMPLDRFYGLPLILLLQVVFMADIYIFANTCIVSDGGRLVSRRAAVIVLRWKVLLCDVLAALPLDLICYLASAPFWVTTSFHALRMLKAVKVLTPGSMFQTSNRVAMNSEYVRFYFLTLPLLKYLAWLMLFVHLLTVVKVYISSGEVSLDGTSFKSTDIHDESEQTVERILLRWSDACFWVWTLLTTGSFTLYVNDPEEKAYAGVLMAIGVVTQGIVVAKMSVLLLQANVQQQTAEKMRSTLTILEHYNIPLPLQQEILSYQHHMMSQSAESLANELSFLPDRMQREILVYVKMEALDSVKLFAAASHACRIRVVNALEPCLAMPDQSIILNGETGNEMFFLVHGYADVIIPIGAVVATLTSGDAFGEIALLSADCKRTATIRALTYCDLFRLDKTAFMDVLMDFKEFRASVQLEMKSRGISDEQMRQLFGRARRISNTPFLPCVNSRSGALLPPRSASTKDWTDSGAVSFRGPRLSARGSVLSTHSAPQRRMSPAPNGLQIAMPAAAPRRLSTQQQLAVRVGDEPKRPVSPRRAHFASRQSFSQLEASAPELSAPQPPDHGPLCDSRNSTSLGGTIPMSNQGGPRPPDITNAGSPRTPPTAAAVPSPPPYEGKWPGDTLSSGHEAPKSDATTDSIRQTARVPEVVIHEAREGDSTCTSSGSSRPNSRPASARDEPFVFTVRPGLQERLQALSDGVAAMTTSVHGQVESLRRSLERLGGHSERTSYGGRMPRSFIPSLLPPTPPDERWGPGMLSEVAEDDQKVPSSPVRSATRSSRMSSYSGLSRGQSNMSRSNASRSGVGLSRSGLSLQSSISTRSLNSTVGKILGSSARRPSTSGASSVLTPRAQGMTAPPGGLHPLLPRFR